MTTIGRDSCESIGSRSRLPLSSRTTAGVCATASVHAGRVTLELADARIHPQAEVNLPPDTRRSRLGAWSHSERLASFNRHACFHTQVQALAGSGRRRVLLVGLGERIDVV